MTIIQAFAEHWDTFLIGIAGGIVVTSIILALGRR